MPEEHPFDRLYAIYTSLASFTAPDVDVINQKTTACKEAEQKLRRSTFYDLAEQWVNEARTKSFDDALQETALDLLTIATNSNIGRPILKPTTTPAYSSDSTSIKSSLPAPNDKDKINLVADAAIQLRETLFEVLDALLASVPLKESQRATIVDELCAIPSKRKIDSTSENGIAYLLSRMEKAETAAILSSEAQPLHNANPFILPNNVWGVAPQGSTDARVEQLASVRRELTSAKIEDLEASAARYGYGSLERGLAAAARGLAVLVDDIWVSPSIRQAAQDGLGAIYSLSKRTIESQIAFVETLREITENPEEFLGKFSGVKRQQKTPEPDGMHIVTLMAKGQDPAHANRFLDLARPLFHDGAVTAVELRIR